VHERDQARAQLQSAVQQANARIQEANNAVAQERATAKKHADEFGQRMQRAEARIAQIQQENQSKIQEMEARLKEAQSGQAQRQKRVGELEQAMEGANATRVKGEKELQARIQAADQKANEAAARLAAAMGDRKALDTRHLKDLDELTAKHRGEVERRDQVKAQEVKRLQDAVQEKSKQLKVVELELARYKSKAVGPPTASSPSRATAPTSPGLPPARVNPAPPPLHQPSDDATAAFAIPPQVAAPSQSRPPLASQPRPAVAARRPSQPLAEERPAQPPPAPAKVADDDADFTSIIDNLGD